MFQLFREEPISRFRSIDDVKSCSIRGSDVCVPAGGVEEDFWNSAVAGARSGCATAPEEEQPIFIGVESDSDSPVLVGLDAVENGKCKFFMAATSTIAVASHKVLCGDFSVVGETFFRMSIGYVLPKNSPLTELLSIATLELQQEGFLKTPLEYANDVFPPPCDVGSSQRIGLGRLGSFLLAGFLCQLSILICLRCQPGEASATE